MRKARRQARKSRMLIMNKSRRYRAEWEGEWKWATTARTNIARVMRAATGWMTRVEERVVRADEGRSKAVGSSGWKMRASYGGAMPRLDDAVHRCFMGAEEGEEGRRS